MINSQKKAHQRRNNILTISSLVILGVVLFLAENGYILNAYTVRIVRMCGIYSITAISMNLINGMTGQFSLGHAGFMAIGAYVTTLMCMAPEAKEALYYIAPINPFIRALNAPFFVALIVGGIVAGIAAFLIGFPVLRLRGDYLGIASLGFSEIIRILITNWASITNGAIGIKNIPATANVWWTTIAAGLTIFGINRLMKTSYGRAFKSIRDDEIAAEAMGVSLFRHKMMSFILSAFLAGVSGGLLASVIGSVNPNFYRFTLTYEILLIVVLGGQGSITGSVIGAVLVTVMKEWLRFLDEGFNILFIKVPAIAGMRMLVFSILLMLIILFKREGLMGSREFSWDGLFEFIASIPKRISAFVGKIANLFNKKKGEA